MNLENSNEINDLQIGKAGEYLVCADLILAGHVAFPSEQGLPFDVVAVVNDRIFKIQVKTTRRLKAVPQRKLRSDKYLFNIRRCGKGGRKIYLKNDVDVFALIALDKRIIGYLKADNVKQSMHFLPEDGQNIKLAKVLKLSDYKMKDAFGY